VRVLTPHSQCMSRLIHPPRYPHPSQDRRHNRHLLHRHRAHLLDRHRSPYRHRHFLSDDPQTTCQQGHPLFALWTCRFNKGRFQRRYKRPAFDHRLEASPEWAGTATTRLLDGGWGCHPRQPQYERCHATGHRGQGGSVTVRSSRYNLEEGL